MNDSSRPVWSTIPGSALPDSLGLVDHDAPIRGHVREVLLRAARPFHLNRRGAVRAQAERQRQIALRAVARPAPHHRPLLAHTHDRADSIAIGLGAYQPHAQPVIAIAAIVAI